MSTMLASINFLFLTALAITSWIILCYFKQIEGQRERVQGITIDFTMEQPYDESIMGGGAKSCGNNYDIYLNFVCIFACVYALAKITHLTENYITKRVQSRLRRNGIFGEPEPKSSDECQLNVKNLLVQIKYLEKRNALLEQQLHEWQQSCGGGGGGGGGGESATASSSEMTDEINTPYQTIAKLRPPLHQQAKQQQQQNLAQPNIYITNRHFHVNQRQVFVNEGNVKLNFPSEEGGDFTQIWHKYLDIQPATALITNGIDDNMDFPNPVVMTNVQLQNIQGHY